MKSYQKLVSRSFHDNSAGKWEHSDDLGLLACVSRVFPQGRWELPIYLSICIRGFLRTFVPSLSNAVATNCSLRDGLHCKTIWSSNCGGRRRSASFATPAAPAGYLAALLAVVFSHFGLWVSLWANMRKKKSDFQQAVITQVFGMKNLTTRLFRSVW